MQKSETHIKRESSLLRSNAVLLLLLYAFIILKPVVPYVDYLLRKEFIINNFCINREAPEKQCNGKCHLEKQLVKEVEESDGNEAPPPPQTEKKELQEYLITGQKKVVPIQDGKTSRALYHGQYSYQYVPSIFHPPMHG